MRICLVASNDALRDPRALATRHVLARSGHEVTTVSFARGEAPGTVFVEPGPTTLTGRVWRRLQPRPLRERWKARKLAQAAARLRADIYQPTHVKAFEASVLAARQVGALVSRTPQMPSPEGLDLIEIAPCTPQVAEPVAGSGARHTPDDTAAPYRPAPDRHAGRSVVICYRKSGMNPGRYLEDALRRSGAAVRVETQSIDLSTVPADTDAVVFVEGPYPRLEVTGTTSVPTLFWVHHGEHHLYTNVRLADRYRADAVLLAHSWHLAYWFPTPVHRFPFGMAAEMFDPSRDLAERQFDVAMVGARLRGGGPYERRQQIVRSLEDALPSDRLAFAERVSAEHMAVLYGDARVVINEGGTRHLPITMRVLEAVGAGAVLLSDPAPGQDMILMPHLQYAVMTDDVVADVSSLLSDLPRMRRMAQSARDSALGLHTYDHRVDELLDIAANISKRELDLSEPASPLAKVVDRDVEVQRVAQVGADGLAEALPDREVWDATTLEPHRLAPGKMESVAIVADDVAPLRDVLRAARRYIYIEGRGAGLAEYLEQEQPQATVREVMGVLRVDLRAPSYRVEPFEATTT